MDTALIGTLIVLALVDATSLGTLGVPVFLLTARTPASRILLFLLTITVFYFVVGLALMLGLDALVDAIFIDITERLSPRTEGIGLIIVGGLLFLASEWIDRRRKHAPERTWVPESMQPRAFVMLALLAGIIEVATMVPYLSAIGLLIASDVSVATRATILLGYTLVMVIPALVLMGLTLMLGKVIQPVLDRLGRWIRKNADTMLSWALAAVGIILALNGVSLIFNQG